MALIVFAETGTPHPGPVDAGENIRLHYSVAKFGSARADPASAIKLSVYRYDSSGAQQFVTDRDGLTLQNIAVATKEPVQAGDDSEVFYFVWKSRTDAAAGLYYAKWEGQFRGEFLPLSIDRIVLKGATGQPGSVEFEGTQAA